MARTYKPSDLSGVQVTKITWARAWVRFLLRDTPNEVGAYRQGSLDDIEIDAALELHSVLDSVGSPLPRYYRPHVTAAGLLESDPERLASFSGGGYSEQYRGANEVIAPMLSQGARFDAEIALLSQGRVAPSAATLEPVF